MPDTNSSQSQQEGKFGSLLHTPEFEAAPQALPPTALIQPPFSSLPPVANLRNLPAIATQGTPKSLGSPGSCEAQSFGYGLGSYTAAREPDGSIKWDASLAENQVSAAFLYNFEHHQRKNSCPKGSMATPYLQYLIAHGSPSAQDLPYYPDCSYLNKLPLKPQFPNMTRFCLGSFATFNIKKDPDSALELIKLLIANGLAVAFSGLVLQGYANNPVFTDGVICETAIIPNSGHGQLVVGYDDRLGALLIQNSFGAAWPPAGSGSLAPQGMAYWSYTTFKSTQILAATAYPRGNGPLTGSMLKHAIGPDGCLNRAFQWAPAAGNGVWLVLILQFAGPLRLESVTIIEPGTATSVNGNYGHYLSNGYLYFKRTDGHQFIPGEYSVTLAGYDLSGASIEYSGSVAVGAAQAEAPPQALRADTSVTDTIGGAATIIPQQNSLPG